MKKIIALLLAMVIAFGLIGCGTSSDTEQTLDNATQIASETHTIAVLVYNYSDEEVIAFRNYLEDYIAENFNVDFLYSSSITSEDEELEFINEAAEAGAEGIMSFNSYDLEAEVDLAAENGMYYMMASGTVSDEEFAAVEDNEYFLGVVGPGADAEYQAGVDVAQHFIDEHDGDEYFILSGGASMGNTMHEQRTMGILDTLAEAYGVTFDQTTQELAESAEPVLVEAGDLKICICPGYLDFENFLDTAIETYEANPYSTVLSVLPVVDFSSVIRDADLGMIDSYNTRNLQLFTDGRLDYLTGKYSSEIGPSFAAMYNAVTGYADAFREDGHAFQLTQGFWTSDSAEDYENKYTLAASLELNAYSAEDLQQVISIYNPDASLDDLAALAESYTYEDVVARRGLEMR